MIICENYGYYLYRESQFWTMTPSGFEDNSFNTPGYVAVYNVGEYQSTLNNNYSIRPVLSLKSNITIKGSGTLGDPYEVIL